MSETTFALIITTILLLASPGPAPIALAAAGATLGFRKGLPFMFGMLTGFSLVIVLTFSGLAVLFTQFPIISYIFTLLGSLFLFYIAYKIATSKTLISAENQHLLTFKTGFIINILNPKVYVAMVALITQASQIGDGSALHFMTVGLTIFAIAIVIDITWLSIGQAIQPLFNHTKYQSAIRYFFAIALAVVVSYQLVKIFFIS